MQHRIGRPATATKRSLSRAPPSALETNASPSCPLSAPPDSAYRESQFKGCPAAVYNRWDGHHMKATRSRLLCGVMCLTLSKSASTRLRRSAQTLLEALSPSRATCRAVMLFVATAMAGSSSTPASNISWMGVRAALSAFELHMSLSVGVEYANALIQCDRES